MSLNILTNYEKNELLDLIHSLMFVENRNCFRQIAWSFKEFMEFDFLIFGLPGPISEESQAVVDLNINYPQNWVDLYQANEFWRIDPVVIASRNNCAPQRWDDIFRRYPPNKEFVELARNYGLIAGWTCLNRGNASLSWTIISVSGKRKRSKSSQKREKYIFERLSPHFHIALSSLKKKDEAQKHQNVLTKRECEVLRWLSQGKTSWEISVILNVAEVTVNFHIKNIKSKLNTVSRSHAVAVAAHRGLLYCDCI